MGNKVAVDGPAGVPAFVEGQHGSLGVALTGLGAQHGDGIPQKAVVAAVGVHQEGHQGPGLRIEDIKTGAGFVAGQAHQGAHREQLALGGQQLDGFQPGLVLMIGVEPLQGVPGGLLEKDGKAFAHPERRIGHKGLEELDKTLVGQGSAELGRIVL